VLSQFYIVQKKDIVSSWNSHKYSKVKSWKNEKSTIRSLFS